VGPGENKNYSARRTRRTPPRRKGVALIVAGGRSNRAFRGGRCSGSRRRRKLIDTWRECRPRYRSSRSCSPFAAPIVVADQGPHAFDKVTFGAERIQVWGVPPALAPHCGPSVNRAPVAAVVELAVHAFSHVAFSSRCAAASMRAEFAPCHRCDAARPLAGN